MGEEIVQTYKMKDIILAGRNTNDNMISFAQTDNADVYNSFIQLAYSMRKVWDDC